MTSQLFSSTSDDSDQPTIDDLLDHADSKFGLVIFGARRARQINDYYTQLQEGFIENVGPLVETKNNEKPLSIAFREIDNELVSHNISVTDRDNDTVSSDIESAEEVGIDLDSEPITSTEDEV